MTGVERIAAERQRQSEVEGWTAEHDDGHEAGEMAYAAACYAAPQPIFLHQGSESGFFSGNTGDRGDRQLQSAGYYSAWPWETAADKRDRHSRLRQLEIAGALIAAEIDRLERVKSQPEAADYGDREALGREVYRVRSENKPVVAWEDRPEGLREVDRRIGERLFRWGYGAALKRSK